MLEILNFKKIVFVILVCASSFSLAEKRESFSGISLIPPIQAPERSEGALTRFSFIYGQHAAILGFDLGLIGNMTDQIFIGSALSGVFNINSGKTFVIGAQVAGLTNWIKGDLVVAGVEATAGLNYVKGTGHVGGLQLAGLGNIAARTNIYGAQIGLYNEAGSVYGFQIGLINVAQSLHGIQIGLINIHKSGLLRIMPGINIGF